MTLGLALYTPLAIMGGVFYLVHHIIVKANLFLVSGVANKLAGHTDLNRIGGLYKSSPLLAALFVIPAFSLAGFPPLSGFWAKYLIVKAAIELDAWLIAFVALFVGLLTIFSMTKIWGMAFWKPHPDGYDPTPDRAPDHVRVPMMIPIAGLAAMTIVIGFYPEPFVHFAEVAATQLLDPTQYVETVLGARPEALLEGPPAAPVGAPATAPAEVQR